MGRWARWERTSADHITRRRYLVVGGWSPDGARIVFDATVAGNSDVYVVGSDGGRVHRLTSEPSIDGLSSWSADGWIYFPRRARE